MVNPHCRVAGAVNKLFRTTVRVKRVLQHSSILKDERRVESAYLFVVRSYVMWSWVFDPAPMPPSFDHSVVWIVEFLQHLLH